MVKRRRVLLVGVKRSNFILLVLVFVCVAVVVGCGGLVPDNFTFDTSNHQTNPQPLLGVDIKFDPQISLTNTNTSNPTATNSNTSNPTVTATTSDTTTNSNTGGSTTATSTNTNSSSTVK